ncbi:MAG: nucleoside deaminase [Chloroflexi bacterium]|nr:nucleoside deaminase [Chloroflexota bacterium]
MWNALPLFWQACLEESWQAYCAGTVPIGAVIVDEHGTILARGRNQIIGDGNGMVRGHELAHAELNALLAVNLQSDHRIVHQWSLYTIMEPCPLCMGAFYMSGIRNLHYAARDPYAGSVNLLGTTPYLSHKPIRVTHQDDPTLEEIVIGINMEWMLSSHGSLPPIFIKIWRDAVPRGVALGERLVETKLLRQMRDGDCAVDEVVGRLSELMNDGH